MLGGRYPLLTSSCLWQGAGVIMDDLPTLCRLVQDEGEGATDLNYSALGLNVDRRRRDGQHISRP